MKEVAELILKQKKVIDKMFQKYLDKSDELERMLNAFNLEHLNDNEIEELCGFSPYMLCEIDIIKQKSEVFLIYTVYKSEEDFQNCNIQKMTLPLSTIEKYIKTTKKRTDFQMGLTNFPIKILPK